MRNKKLTALAFIAVVFTAMAFIANPSIKNDQLKGTWQLVAEGKLSSMVKIFNSDGSIINLVHSREGFVYTMEGKYTVNSASEYTEKIEKSFYQALNGTSNKVTYKVNGDELKISFLVSGNEYSETYKKVGFLQK